VTVVVTSVTVLVIVLERSAWVTVSVVSLMVVVVCGSVPSSAAEGRVGAVVDELVGVALDVSVGEGVGSADADAAVIVVRMRTTPAQMMPILRRGPVTLFTGHSSSGVVTERLMGNWRLSR
jgi:hypothetical protein